MNVLEKEMIELLKRLRDEHGAFAIKAEFEAEGSRMEELMRLKDVTSAVNLPIILKIGGVEAITDVHNGLAIGVKGLIAPMAETAYALSKYLGLIKNTVPKENAEDIEFAFNLETITAYKNYDEMIKLPDFYLLSGITIGRVDLTGSMGLGRDAINTSEEVYQICETIFKKSKKTGLKTGLGGGICKEAIPFIKRLNQNNLLDRFETRKVVFPATSVEYGEEAILSAVRFELLWLKSKRRYYSKIKSEDESRIAMLEKRLL